MGSGTYARYAVLLQQIFNSHVCIYFVVYLVITRNILHESLEIPAVVFYICVLLTF